MLARLMPLPPFPGVRLEEVEDLTPANSEGFLTLRRRRMRVIRGGEKSESFIYDAVDRRALDAVVVVAHFRRGDESRVYLRSALRPPPVMRAPEQRPFPEAESLGQLWEVVAGLVEPDECSREGIVDCARRELAEELGFAVKRERILPLGPSMFPSPGVIGERLHFFMVEVAPDDRREPSGDGSVLEREAQIVHVSLAEALELVAKGAIEDLKTEVALRRLEESR
jgi:ADP-ribose pyrophosphatase